MQPPRKHLLYFVTEDWFFCSHFIDRAIAAQRMGYRVTVVTRVDRCGETISRAGLSLVPIELRRRSLNPVREASTILRIAGIYAREKPHLVHHFALKPIIYGTIAARLSSIRHLVNAPVGMGFVFSSSSLLARALRPFMRLALRLLLNPSGSIAVFENSDDYEEAIGDGLICRQRSAVIPGAGVDTAHFHPTVKPEGAPKIVLVSRMLWEKGVGDFVEAARKLRERKCPARFVLVGAPDKENPASIPESQLESWRDEGVVEWLGFRTDIAAILADCHIFCLPTRYREGLPKAILEALSAGLPVVTTDVPGCHEAVRHGENGLLVPSGAPEALAQALTILVGDPELRRRMGEAGRLRAEREFSSGSVCEATLDLYRKLLAS